MASSRSTSIDRLLKQLKAAEKLPRDTRVNPPIGRLSSLCEDAIRALRLDPIVLEVSTPINIIGDLHGQFYDLLTYFQRTGLPPATSYLFLGDYVDRGRNSIETISFLLALKVKYPKYIWLLRGNHETPDLSRLYGFEEECAERYPGSGLFDKFNEVFRWLPLAAVAGEGIFCVHGGLSPDLVSLDQIRAQQRPLDIPEDGLLSDLLWADPNTEHVGYEESERGTSYTFGADVVREFLNRNGFDLLCRGHQCVTNGFEFPFGAEQTVLTVFSAPNYCEEFPNKGAMLKVDKGLRCMFEYIMPDRPPVEPVRPSTTRPGGRAVKAV
jgi:serine/threonine-protein phosphatase PP1 catalytic subunit